MIIRFKTQKMLLDGTDRKRAVKRWGPECGMLVMKRLDELRAAPNLEAMRMVIPARCHELKGERKGLLSLDVKHPYRLLFTVAQRPLPVKPDGGLDWREVTEVMIVDVEDTHG